MLVFACALLILSGLATASQPVDEYFDAVLNNRFPNELDRAGAKESTVYLKDFTDHFQNRSSDGAVTNGRISYIQGNLTGLTDIRRNLTCESLRWHFANLTTSCIVVLPKVQVYYSGKIKYDFNDLEKVILAEANVTDTYVRINVTSSPIFNLPTLTKIENLRKVKLQVRLRGIEQLNYRSLNQQFYDSVNATLSSVFHGIFKTALYNSVRLEPLPLVD